MEAIRLRVREQKELLAGANKELRRLKKTLKTYEVPLIGACTCFWKNCLKNCLLATLTPPTTGHMLVPL